MAEDKADRPAASDPPPEDSPAKTEDASSSGPQVLDEAGAKAIGGIPLQGIPRVVSLIVLLAVVLLIGVLFFRVMATFLIPLFLAAVLTVVFKPLHSWVLGKLNGRPQLSALATTLLISLLVLVPTATFAWRAFAETARIVRIALHEEDTGVATVELPAEAGTEPVIATDPGDETPDAVADSAVEAPAGEAPPAKTPAGETEPPISTADANGDAEGWTDRLWERLTPYTDWYKTLNPDVDLEAAGAEFAQYAARSVVNLGLVGIQGLVSFLFGLAIMIFALYYFFADGPSIIETLMNLSPLDDDYERELLAQFATVSRAVVVATILSAVVQGLLAGIGYLFVLDPWTPTAAGFASETVDPPLFLLTVATMLLAIVPFLGATAVWVPVVIWVYFVQDDFWPAIAMAVYGTAVVSSIDNVIKPYVLHGQSNLHPLLALLSVLGGLQLLGPIGILVGPMLVAFMQALLGMLRKELDGLQAEASSPSGAESPSVA